MNTLMPGGQPLASQPMPGTIADIPAERFERLERAILGDPDVGHLGAIERLNIVDSIHDNVPNVHKAMQEERVAGDRRLHERLDTHEDENRADLARIERKIDRLWWWLAGAAGAGFIGGYVTGGGTFPTP